MGFGPVGWGLIGFLGLGSLCKHKRITLGKKWCQNTLSIIGFAVRDAELSNEQLSDRL